MTQQEDEQECPVCYEVVSGTERTLSCGHVFCHDCLVKTLVTIHTTGDIGDTIACPVCRHLTFIRKQKRDRQPNEEQTLEVPLPLPQPTVPPQGSVEPTRAVWVSHCFWERVRRQRLISPSHNGSQIFIISTEGRPMAEDDTLGVVMTVVQPQRRRGRRICTTTGCLVILLSVFTISALVAATLPLILLA